MEHYDEVYTYYCSHFHDAAAAQSDAPVKNYNMEEHLKLLELTESQTVVAEGIIHVPEVGDCTPQAVNLDMTVYESR